MDRSPSRREGRVRASEESTGGVSWQCPTKHIRHQTYHHPTGRKIAQRLYTDKNDKKLLRVVYEEEDETKVVITCYLTSQIERYRKEGKYESDV